jgi:hypothetical protein
MRARAEEGLQFQLEELRNAAEDHEHANAEVDEATDSKLVSLELSPCAQVARTGNARCASLQSSLQCV